jgi:hypothetical protein
MGYEGEAGGAGIPGTGYLRVGVTVGPPGTFNEWRPMPLGEQQLESIVRVSPGWEVKASRAGIQGVKSCVNCNPPVHSTPWYLLSGTSIVTVEKVIPLQVAARQPAVARGETVTFDAVAIEGTTNLTWMYISTERGTQVEARLDSCHGRTTCSYAPQRNGYMAVFGNWGYNSTSFSAQSEPVRVVDASLTLECTPNPVTRGEAMNCTAKAHPATGQLANVRWTFTDSTGNSIPGPSDNRVTWGGIMVVGGTMHVSAEINGVPVNAEPVEVKVERRFDWRVSFPAVPEPEKSAALPYPPVTTPGGEVGEGVFGQYVYPYAFPASPVRGGTGPNQNWYYVRAPLEVDEPHILINRGLYPDDPFFRAQRGGLDEDGYRRCDAAFMRSAFAFVVSHERRHHEIAAEFFGTAGSEMLEAAAVYSPATEDVLDVADILLAPTITALEGRQSAFDKDSKLRVTCKLQPLQTRDR